MSVRYDDGTFTLFRNKDAAIKFLHYPNSRHDNIQFTIEFENNQQIPFLDVSIKRLDNNSFSTSIYHKRTFTGLYTKWDSFSHSALNDFKDLLSRNGYPQGVITYNMSNVVNRNRNKPKDPITTVPKREVFIVLPYLGLQRKFITRQLKSCIYKFYARLY